MESPQEKRRTDHENHLTWSRRSSMTEPTCFQFFLVLSCTKLPQQVSISLTPRIGAVFLLPIRLLLKTVSLFLTPSALCRLHCLKFPSKHCCLWEATWLLSLGQGSLHINISNFSFGKCSPQSVTTDLVQNTSDISTDHNKIAQHWRYTKNYWIVHFKMLTFMACELYTNNNF